MGEIKTGLRGLLRRPFAYEALQTVMGAERGLARFVACHVRPRPGDRVLDIGCGTARLAEFLGDVTYIGYEPNPAYVERARARPGKIEVHQGYFDAEAAQRLDPADLAIVSAVLHHMSDGQARELFALLAQVLKPGGRVVTVDNVFVEGQNPVARLLIAMDRGRDVRTPAGYAALPRASFGVVDGEVSHQTWIPYTFWHMECREPRPPPVAAAIP